MALDALLQHILITWTDIGVHTAYIPCGVVSVRTTMYISHSSGNKELMLRKFENRGWRTIPLALSGIYQHLVHGIDPNSLGCIQLSDTTLSSKGLSSHQKKGWAAPLISYVCRIATNTHLARQGQAPENLNPEFWNFGKSLLRFALPDNYVTVCDAFIASLWTQTARDN